ncbi:hypothetical protein FACS1894105_09840 [Clostridia bacterium]|nr:hypothetical protein FACS1894105_09840 [Clostridia bacterium]
MKNVKTEKEIIQETPKLADHTENTTAKQSLWKLKNIYDAHNQIRFDYIQGLKTQLTENIYDRILDMFKGMLSSSYAVIVLSGRKGDAIYRVFEPVLYQDEEMVRLAENKLIINSQIVYSANREIDDRLQKGGKVLIFDEIVMTGNAVYKRVTDELIRWLKIDPANIGVMAFAVNEEYWKEDKFVPFWVDNPPKKRPAVDKQSAKSFSKISWHKPQFICSPASVKAYSLLFLRATHYAGVSYISFASAFYLDYEVFKVFFSEDSLSRAFGKENIRTTTIEDWLFNDDVEFAHDENQVDITNYFIRIDGKFSSEEEYFYGVRVHINTKQKILYITPSSYFANTEICTLLNIYDDNFSDEFPYESVGDTTTCEYGDLPEREVSVSTGILIPQRMAFLRGFATAINFFDKLGIDLKTGINSRKIVQATTGTLSDSLSGQAVALKLLKFENLADILKPLNRNEIPKIVAEELPIEDLCPNKYCRPISSNTFDDNDTLKEIKSYFGIKERFNSIFQDACDTFNELSKAKDFKETYLKTQFLQVREITRIFFEFFAVWENISENDKNANMEVKIKNGISIHELMMMFKRHFKDKISEEQILDLEIDVFASLMMSGDQGGNVLFMSLSHIYKELGGLLGTEPNKYTTIIAPYKLRYSENGESALLAKTYSNRKSHEMLGKYWVNLKNILNADFNNPELKKKMGDIFIAEYLKTILSDKGDDYRHYVSYYSHFFNPNSKWRHKEPFVMIKGVQYKYPKFTSDDDEERFSKLSDQLYKLPFDIKQEYTCALNSVYSKYLEE